MIDDEFEIQKLIFKKNKELVLSKNGQVQIGKWDYFPEAKSLLIDRNSDKILCNEAFIDQGVMILKLDGTENRFFVLANENIVPDLDALGYLEKLRVSILFIKKVELSDGSFLEVHRESDVQTYLIGNDVSMNAEPVQDDIYQDVTRDLYYDIRQSRIYRIITKTRHRNSNGQVIEIHRLDNKFWITPGDYVFLDDKRVDNGIIDYTRMKVLIIKDGVLLRIKYKYKLLNWLTGDFS